MIFLSKARSPSTLNRKGGISKPELYHASQQLSQYEFPIRMFSQKHKYMYMEQSSCKLLSKKCHKHVTFQKFNPSVVLVHFKLHKSMSKYHTCTKKRRGIVKPTFGNEASAVEAGKWAYGPMVGSAYPT